MKLLVTGGAGFIGSNFIHYWLKKYPKDKIRVLDALTFAGNKDNLQSVMKKIEFVEGDITNRVQVKDAMKGIDVVVHYAAESHVDRSIFEPGKFWKTNVDGTKILLEEAELAKIPRFHHISTDEVYGELPLNSDLRFSEKTPYAPRPDNLYAVSKAEADHIVREFVKGSKMHITISNCSNNYGPYQFPEKFVPILVTNIIDGLKAPVHGDGKNVRDWIHTLDHATAIDLILEKGKRGETYLIGSKVDVSNIFIAEHVVDLMGKDESWIKYVPDRTSNDRRYAIDATKIIHELGWKPVFTKENFGDGLGETIDWYKQNKDWWKPLLSRKAVVQDGDNKIYAFIEIDRTIGKTKFVYGQPEEQNKVIKLGQKLVEEDPRRVKLITQKLKSHDWFRNSKLAIQKKLVDLAKNAKASGFVEDLANRPETVSGFKQLQITKLEHAIDKHQIYGVAVWFEVEDSKGGRHTEGFYSWAMGVKSGAKMLVLVRHKEKLTHIALTKEQKFAVGSEIYNLPGGFPRVNESVFDLIHRKLEDDLGVDVRSGNITVGDIIGLGRVMPDAGMTNNHPFLYTVVLDLTDNIFPPIRMGEVYETGGKLVLWPIERLSELVNKVDDSYFLSCLSRLILSGATELKII